MIEPYNIGTNSSIMLMIGRMTGKVFYFLIILLTILIIISLIMWLLGSCIKSEKVIKFGVKSFILSILIQLFVLVMPIIITFFNNGGN